MSMDVDFTVRLARTGTTVPVRRDQTVANALAAHGVRLPTSCAQGVCGTCLTRVLAGEPDHWDSYLTPEEQAANDRFLPCCSRAQCRAGAGPLSPGQARVHHQ